MSNDVVRVNLNMYHFVSYSLKELSTTAEFPDHMEELKVILLKVCDQIMKSLLSQ